MNKLLILGAGGHGQVAMEIAENHHQEIVFLDDYVVADIHNKEVRGKLNQYVDFDHDEYDCFIAIGDNDKRLELYNEMVSCGFKVINLIHPSSVISKYAKMGNGIIIMPNAVVQTNSIIEDAVIINTSCIVEHDCKILQASHLSYGCIVGSNTTINAKTTIAIGQIIQRNQIY